MCTVVSADICYQHNYNQAIVNITPVCSAVAVYKV